MSGKCSNAKLTTREQLLAMLEAIRPLIRRYPAIDEDVFVRRIDGFLRDV